MILYRTWWCSNENRGKRNNQGFILCREGLCSQRTGDQLIATSKLSIRYAKKPCRYALLRVSSAVTFVPGKKKNKLEPRATFSRARDTPPTSHSFRFTLCSPSHSTAQTGTVRFHSTACRFVIVSGDIPAIRSTLHTSSPPPTRVVLIHVTAYSFLTFVFLPRK